MTKKKIPDNARLVFKGALHDIYQWDQEMFDGSTAVFEAIRKRDGITVVAVVGENIIVNREEQPYRGEFLSLPGGLSEGEEDPLSNAKRELLEETGYISSDWELWFVSDILNYVKMDWNNHFFIARDCKKVGEQKLDAGEKIDVTFVTFDDFLELRNNPMVRNHDLFPILEKISKSEEETEKVKKLFGLTN
ncbi:MAG: ADP-ribose pyrophosphatase [Patescibacteria group bacterium]|nr:ADP-ribose pyrophosphatase [Patescibacteria group bacterium]